MQKRHGFVTVNKLKQFVESEVKRIESQPLTVRGSRQLKDAVRFLNLLNEPRYVAAKKITDLTSRIANERRKLIEMSRSLDEHLLDCQLTLFEDKDSVTEEQKRAIKLQKVCLEEEIHWLHKCLGICYNKEYFK